MIMTGNPAVLGKNPIFRKLMDFVKVKGGFFDTNKLLEQHL